MVKFITKTAVAAESSSPTIAEIVISGMESINHISNGVSPKNHRSRGNTIKILSLVILAMLCFSSMAQDIILKKDGTEIIAKVLELTDQQVKYKEFDFQSGPTRNINISDVFMITYENGKKEVFNMQPSTPTTTTTTPTEKPYSTLSSDLKREFYQIGDNDYAMMNFFRNNHFTEYDNRFASACHRKSVGISLLSSGISLSISGVTFVAIGTFSKVYSISDIDRYRGYRIVGYLLLGAGETLVIASVPCFITAATTKRTIKNDFEKEYFGTNDYTYQPKLNFGTTSNGIGLTLNF